MNLATQITALRLLLTPIFILFLFYFNPSETAHFKLLATAIFSVACLTDALDGFIARKFNQQTVLGAYFDPIADKLLLASGYLCLTFMGNLPAGMKVPAWVTICVVTRDMIISIGFIMIFLIKGKIDAKPLLIGKLTTFFQMITLILALCELSLPILMVFFGISCILTIISGLEYIRLGSEILK